MGELAPILPGGINTTAHAKHYLRLIIGSFEATTSLGSASAGVIAHRDHGNRSPPLCIAAIGVALDFLVGNDTRTHKLYLTGSERHELLSSSIHWALSLTSDDDVRQCGLEKLRCRCDMSDPRIAPLHKFTDQVAGWMKRVGTIAFTVMGELLKQVDDQKLGKLSLAVEGNRAKRKHRPFEALSTRFVTDSEAFARSCCSWYRAWGCDVALEVFKKSIDLQREHFGSTSTMSSLLAVNSELLLSLLHRLDALIDHSHTQAGLERTDFREADLIGRVLDWVSGHASDDLACAQRVLDPQTKEIYTLIGSILFSTCADGVGYEGRDMPLSPIRLIQDS